MNLVQVPIACELFAQWQRARGGRLEPASRPFSRVWEDLLEDSRLLSATERSDAERDVRALQKDGWLEVRSVRYKPHLIDRVILPLAAEPRWCAAFGFVAPTGEEARQIRDFPWVPQLAFVRDARLNVSFIELKQLNDFIKAEEPDHEVVPIKERSLQIFGDEKRLDALVASALFREGRLNERRDLRCEVIGVPLAWKRGPKGAAAQPILVLENAATWHSYCRWNALHHRFSAVVYGDGNRFVDGIRYLADIFAEIGEPRPIFYFGDLDPQGLAIPQEASTRGHALGLPGVEPHLWSYRQLLKLGEGRGQPWEGELPSPALCDWLGEYAKPAYQMFTAGHRHAQEHIGWEFLKEIVEMV